MVDDPYCSVPECGKECQPSGPAFCPDHWQEMSKPRRKYLLSEWTMGEKARWPDWMRKAFNDTVATIADRMRK